MNYKSVTEKTGYLSNMMKTTQKKYMKHLILVKFYLKLFQYVKLN